MINGAMFPVFTILISTQHDKTATNEEIATEEHVIKPVTLEQYLDEKTTFHLPRAFAANHAQLLTHATIFLEPLAPEKMHKLGSVECKQRRELREKTRRVDVLDND